MRNLALMWVLGGVAVALLEAGDGKPPVSTFTDKRDGKVYRIVEINGQTWFAENLNYAAKGSRCFGEGGKVEVTKTLSHAKVQANCAEYGRLYNWETALTACPAGTHLPTDEEWVTLVDYAGGEKKAGKKLKSTGSWNNGTDEYGFSALLGGYGTSGGYFFNNYTNGRWWSATEINAWSAWYWGMLYFNEDVFKYAFSKTDLFSVRCVQDDEKERRK